jgi:peptidoglycan/xylan/chitin deacetylase (PgdA/CDA1 family)
VTGPGVPRGNPPPTVCVTVDFDAVSLWLAWGYTGMRAMSRGEFGARVGAPRLLDLLAKWDVRSTWFTPGHTADSYAAITAAVHDRGHELAHHGYLHEDFSRLSPATARRIIRKGSASLRRITGEDPRGFRAPGGELDGALIAILVDEGFLYDSSYHGEFDLDWARAADSFDPDGPYVDGERLDLVELPTCPIQSDFVHFEFIWAPQTPAGLRNPADVEDIWRRQLDYLCDVKGSGCYNLILHPQSIGYGSRMAMLDRFLEYCTDKPNLRFATCRDVAAEFRLGRQGPAPAATAS